MGDTYMDLIHCLEDCRSQTKAGFAVTDRVSSFIKAVAKLQNSFGQELKKLAANELSRLGASSDVLGTHSRSVSRSATPSPSLPSQDDTTATMESSRGGLHKVIALVQKHGELQLQTAESTRALAVDRLATYYKRAELKGRELDTQLRYYVGECDKAQDDLKKSESHASKQLASLSKTWATEAENEANLKQKRRSKSGGFNSVPDLPSQLEGPGIQLLENKKVSKSRTKAEQACEKYTQQLKRTNAAFKDRQECLRTALSEMQAIEIKRMEEQKSVLGIFTDCQEKLNRDTERLLASSKESISTIDPNQDIVQFVRSQIAVHGRASADHIFVNPTPFRYDLTYAIEDLKDDDVLFSSLLVSNGEPLGASGAAPLRGRLFATPLEKVLQLQLKQSSEISGVSQSDLDHCNRLQIPLVAWILIDGVRRLGGLGSVGIFRISATTEARDSLIQELERGDYSLSSAQGDPHVCAGTLKTWLRELTPAVISGESYLRCLEISSQLRSKPAPEQTETLQKDIISVLDALPRPNRLLLGLLVNLVREVDQNQAVNRMAAKNMAIVLAPNVLDFDGSPMDPGLAIQNSDLATQFMAELVLVDYDYGLAGSPGQQQQQSASQRSQPSCSPSANDSSLASFFDLAASIPPVLPSKPKLPAQFKQQRQ